MAVFYLCLATLAFSSCSHIPRIIVLNDPLTADEHLSLGLSYEREGEYDHAIEEYSKALKADKRDYRPPFYAANAYYKKGEYALSEKYYSKALRMAPDRSDIHNNLAWVYMDTGRFEEAQGEIDNALKIKRDPYYLDTLANLYDKIGRYEEAIAVLQEALAVTSPKLTELLYNEYKLLGDLYEKMGRHEVAQEARKKAEELIPLTPPLIKGD